MISFLMISFAAPIFASAEISSKDLEATSPKEIAERLKNGEFFAYDIDLPDWFFDDVWAATTESEANKEEIWNYLINKGLSSAGAAGVIGNLEWESSCLPNNLENAAEIKSGMSDTSFTVAVDNGSISREEFITSSRFGVYDNGTYGYGLAQWTYSTRKAGLYDYAKNRGCSIGNLNMQLDYMWQEMSSSLKNYLKNTSDYSDACVEFHNVYEGSADDASRIAGRVKLAKAVYESHGGGGSYLDLNGLIDGVSKGHIADAGVADVYIYDKNGTLIESSVGIDDYYTAWPAGTTYEINNIRGFGYYFDGVQSGSASLSGAIGSSKVTVTLSFSTIPQSSSPANLITYNNHLYERYDYHLSWTEARAFCESNGGHLVTITSEQENEAVKDLLSGCPFGVYSIGATDPNQSGNWSWVTGEPFVYENWDPDSEPSQGQEEYYSQIIGQINPPNKQIGEWNDVENNGGGDFYSKKNSGFICEYETVYTISYDANGGTGAPAPQPKIDGIDLTLSSNQPNREGQYHFLGWAQSPSAKQAEYQPSDRFTINADTTLYAVWKEYFYIDYDANGGPEEIDYIFDGWHYGNTTIRDVNLEYEGHHFVGWSLSKTAGSVDFQPGDHATFTENVILYAVWQRVYASDWSETRPADTKDELIETKTQYRYATKETTSSTSSTLEGWTRDNTSSGWSETGHGSIQYVKSWPSGFNTGHNLYSTYNKQPKSANETSTTKTVINSDSVTGYIYWHWCRGTYNDGPINRTTKTSKQGEWTAFHAFYSTTAPGSLSQHAEDGSHVYSNAGCCKDSYWYYATPVYTQTYTEYTIQNVFYRCHTRTERQAHQGKDCFRYDQHAQ